MAFVVFLMVRQINRLMPPPPVAAGEPRRDCPVLRLVDPGARAALPVLYLASHLRLTRLLTAT